MSEQPNKEDTEEADGEITIEAVDDPESYIQKRRLKDIFGARKEVGKQRKKAKEYEINTSGGKDASIHRSKARRFYRTAVENYLTELRPLFLSDDLGKQYWYQLDLGTIVIEPQYYLGTVGDGPETLKYDHGDKTYLLCEEPEPIEIDLTGLQCLFEIADPISVSFELVVESAGLGRGMNSKTVAENRNIPTGKLDLIMNEANHYLQQRGIELDPEEGLPEDELQL
jgi:hypothetical protein